MLWASGALAQQIDPSMEAMLDRIESGTSAEDRAPVPPTSVSEVNLGVHWRLWKQVLAAGKPGVDELEALRGDATSRGHRNLPAYALAVAYAAGSTPGLDHQEVYQLYDMSQALGPDLPYPYLAEAAWVAERDTARLANLVGSYAKGVVRGMHWPDTRLAWELKFATIMLAAVFAAALFFLLGQIIRHFGIVAYDASRLLPSGFSSNQAVVLLVAAVVVPGLVLQSPLLSMLILLGVLSVLQRLGERVVTLLIFGLIALLPYVDQRMSTRVTWPTSQTQKIVHAQHLHCDADCRTQIAAWRAQLADGGDAADPVLDYTLALSRYRLGTPADLEATLELLEGAQDWPAAVRGEALTLKGAAQVALARPDAAIETLDAARGLMPHSAAPSLNLMRAYQMADDAPAAKRALDEAIARDTLSVRRALELERRDVNSFLTVEPLDYEVFVDRHRARAAEQVSLLRGVWAVLAGPKLPLERAPLLGGIGALIALLGLPLVMRRRTSTPCPRCGMARDPHDAQRTAGHRLCLPCYRTYVAGAELDYNARVYNERVLGRRQRVQEALRRGLSATLPGAGHSLAGHGVAGFVLTFILITGLLLLLRPMGLWRPPYELFTDNWAGQKFFAGFLLTVGIAWALLAAARDIPPTYVEGDRAPMPPPSADDQEAQ